MTWYHVIRFFIIITFKISKPYIWLYFKSRVLHQTLIEDQKPTWLLQWKVFYCSPRPRNYICTLMPSYSRGRAQVKELSQLSPGLGEGQNTTYTLALFKSSNGPPIKAYGNQIYCHDASVAVFAAVVLPFSKHQLGWIRMVPVRRVAHPLLPY